MTSSPFVFCGNAIRIRSGTIFSWFYGFDSLMIDDITVYFKFCLSCSYLVMMSPLT